MGQLIKMTKEVIDKKTEAMTNQNNHQKGWLEKFDLITSSLNNSITIIVTLLTLLGISIIIPPILTETDVPKIGIGQEKSDPNKEEYVFFESGKKAFEQGKFNLAIRDFNLAIQNDFKKGGEASFYIALSYFRLGFQQEACNWAKQAKDRGFKKDTSFSC